MSGGWFRANGYIIHEGRCPRRGSARAWALVDGMPSYEVLEKIANVPWLRLCELCAERMNIPADDPARFSENDTPKVSAETA